MTKYEEYALRTEKLLEPIVAELGFEIYDVEYVKEAGNFFLRIFIDKEGGITIDDCEAVSRRMSELLDINDFIPEAYILEVSSPGLGRQLRKDKHFDHSIGEEVEVKLYKAVEKKKEFVGLLKSYDKENITIELESGSDLVLPRSSVATVRLTFDF